MCVINCIDIRVKSLAIVLSCITMTYPRMMGAQATGSQLNGSESIPSKYEVISIRQNKSDNIDIGGFAVRNRSEGYSAINLTLHMLVQLAYGVDSDLITGGPRWADEVRFNVEARLSDNDSLWLSRLPPERQEAQRCLMLQQLLVDRFSLKIHRDSKTVQVYALTIVRSGAKLKPAGAAATPASLSEVPDGESPKYTVALTSGRLIAKGIRVTEFADQLTGLVGRSVIDETGITGTYDITLRWGLDDPSTSILTLLQEQLGLKLEPRKRQMEGVVIDEVERPSQN